MVRTQNFIIRNKVLERGLVIIIPHRLFQGNGFLTDIFDNMDLFDRYAHFGRDFFGQRLPARDAVAVTMDTAGKAVLFSGATVGAKRATTLPCASTRNFAKFQTTSPGRSG